MRRKQAGASDAFGRHYRLEQEFERAGLWNRPSPHQLHSETRIMTQNLRGFKRDTRMQWLRAWRTIPMRQRPLMIRVQETHIVSTKEADEIECQWRRLWGLSKESTRTTCWSISDKPKGGVGILLYPEALNPTAPWQMAQWNSRVLSVRHEQLGVVMNIYAPNKHRDREKFFAGLRNSTANLTTNTIVVGDFNCVQCPLLDRRGGERPARSESRALDDWMSDRNWVDAREFMGHAEDEGSLPPTAHFTYWKQNSASRIDRFYVSAYWQQQVQWVDVQLPPADSDHQAVTLHLSGRRMYRNKSQRRPSYPIRSTYPDKVLLDLLTEITRRGVGQRSGVQCWDESLTLISEAIANVTKREKQRRQRVTQRIQRQTRANIITRQQLIQAATDDLKATAQIRMGANLENTAEQIRLKFKRWSDWERDQSVTNIRAANGPDYPNTMPVSDRFAIEWSTIQGQRHSDFTDSEQFRAALHDFVEIPENRKVRLEDNHDLMREITTTEIAAAIESLSRHKSARQDGLYNDFYKDAGGILIPHLTKLSNDILQGAEPPESFRRAMIIPLRKKGDSEQAMDYRPIALLQTSYKVFTKVLAMRLQMFLGRLIGATQQGFVHGRQIQKTVAMMLASLQDAVEDINMDDESTCSEKIISLPRLRYF